jgi:hypothetical protein
MKHLASVLLVIGLLASSPSGVAAAVPANDDVANATPITTLPFTTTVDLAEATIEAGEETQICYPSSHTRWFSYDVPAAEILTLDIAGSDPDVGMRVFYAYDGYPPVVGNCLSAQFPSITLSAAPGLTLFLQVASDVGATGLLHLESAPPLVVTGTFDASGTIRPKAGIATFTGTISCNKPARGSMVVEIRQRQGRRTVQDYGYSPEVDCGPTPVSVTLTTTNGLLTAGSALALPTASAIVRSPIEQFDQDVLAGVTAKLSAH